MTVPHRQAKPVFAIRHPLRIAGLLALLMAVPAAAQDSSAEPSAQADWLADVDPDSPMADLPDIGVDWPDIDQPLDPIAALPPEDDTDDIADDTGEAGDIVLPAPLITERADILDWSVSADGSDVQRRYRVVLDGFDDVADDQFRQRFNALSVLRQNEGRPANGAQINRRISEDRLLLDTLLRNDGYYDATLTHEISAIGPTAQIRFTGSLGPLYRYGDVALRGLDALDGEERARLEGVFGIRSGDAIIADQLIAGQVALLDAMLDGGYPFAVVDQEMVTIDHDRRLGDLDQPVTPGDRLTFGTIIANDGGLLGSRHIQTIARFRPGELYQRSFVEDLRRALIATGLVGSATLTPVASDIAGQVDLSVTLAPAPLRTLAGGVGYGTGEGFRAEVSWQHRNLFPPEGALLLRGVIGTREQLASVTLRRSNWMQRDRSLTLQAFVSNSNLPAFNARTVQISVGVERISTLIYQKEWTWALRAEVIATEEFAFVARSNVFARRQFGIVSLSGNVALDRSDDLLDPTRGYRLSLRLAPEGSLEGDLFGYVRGQFDGSAYLPVAGRFVLAGRLRIGAIGGASRDSIAPSRRFYAGGGSSVRGYGFQAIGDRDPNGDPVGGTGLFEGAVEARIPLFGAFSIVPFVDGGNVYATGLPSLSDIGNLRVGAGLGVRYASSFGPIRVDVGTPINPRPGDSRIGVYVSLGQAF